MIKTLLNGFRKKRNLKLYKSRWQEIIKWKMPISRFCMRDPSASDQWVFAGSSIDEESLIKYKRLMRLIHRLDIK